LLDRVRDGRCTAFAPSEAALATYEAERNERAKRTVFASGCRSWYLDKDGVPQVWPWSWDHFCTVMAAPRMEDYELV
jgi:hypothetical protein